MATSERAVRYLTSRKHLAGTAGGLVGVGLALGGVTGPLWPVVVAGLYAVGALAAPVDPPPRDLVREALTAAAQTASELVEDLGRLDERIGASAARLPEGVLPRFSTVRHKLLDMLGHPNALADPEALHVLSTTVRKDLTQVVDGYLGLPVHLRDRSIPGEERTPAQELVRQLQLLDDYVSVTSDRLFSSQTRDIVDLGAYLERRTRPGDLDL